MAVDSPSPAQSAKAAVRDLLTVPMSEFVEDSEHWLNGPDFDAAALVKALSRIDARKQGKVTVPLFDEDSARWFFEKLSEVPFDKVTVDALQKAMQNLSLYPEYSYSVMGSDAWRPSVLPNGALVIRNHHRVVGVWDAYSQELLMTHDELRAALAPMVGTAELQVLNFEPSERSYSGDMVYYRGALPEALSNVGNTAIFVGYGADLSGFDSTYQERLADVRGRSRTGHAVLRVYGDRVLAYSLFRASDEYDALLEDFAEAYFVDDEGSDGESPESCPVNLSSDHNKLKTAIAQELAERLEYVLGHEYSTGTLLGHLLGQRLYADYDSAAGKLVGQLYEFTPFFGIKPHLPAYYGSAEHMPPFVRDSVPDAQVAYLSLPYSARVPEDGTLESGWTRLTAQVDHAASELGATVKLAVGYDSNLGLDAFDQNGALAALGELDEQLHADLEAEGSVDDSAASAEAAENFSESLVFQLKLSGAIDFAQLHETALALSSELGTSLVLTVPAFGISQGYYDGELDTGNGPMFQAQA
jgi:hypothetical protein